MRDFPNGRATRRLLAVLAVAGAASLGTSALAQVEVEPLTVTAEMGVDGTPARLSAVISIADLDLRTEAGEAALQRRIRDTADSLCNQLGETHHLSGSVVPSCRDEAIRNATPQARTAVAMARSGAAAYAAAPPAPREAPVAVAPAPAASEFGAPASVTVRTVTNGPVPDTPENRRRYGQPLSNAGKRTAPVGN